MRFFNTAGPCDPADHYMLPPERRLPGVPELIERKLYFVIHAPRQSGKTTLVQTLARSLTANGSYTALLASCEAGQAAGGDVEAGIATVIGALHLAAHDLPEELRPPTPDESVPATVRLQDLLSRWCRQSPRPVVLFLGITGGDDHRQLGPFVPYVLRQLRAGYGNRPRSFPQCVALVGLRDVRDYKVHLRNEKESLGTSSPFNIKVESLALPNFDAEEIAELYDQHTQDTGQIFTPAAQARAFELTRGQPWLVNALARQTVEKLVPDPAVLIEPAHMDRAKEILIERRDTHLDSLVDRLREPRVKRVLEPILAGEFLSPDVLDDDIQFEKDIGLIATGPAGLEIANPIYREVIPRALTGVLQESLPVRRAPYIAPDDTLLFEKILADFRAFWCQHAEFFLQRQPYSEAAAQLIFMAYLQRVVNGGGFIDREYAVGSGRIDLCVRWPHPGGLQRWAVELKVWRDGRPDPLTEGLEQLSGYLARLGLAEGTLILFDVRSQAPPLGDRCQQSETEYQGKRIAVLRL